MEKEKVIVTLTTWSARIDNIPAVLDTIFAQTYKPDKVVLNLAYDEVIPQKVQDYIDTHNVEVFRTEDTKVYKKLIPTLRRYPNDCVISIDDDWLYPEGMIEDFMTIHGKYPDNPISGNRVVSFGIKRHAGCASLVKSDYFGKYIDSIDKDVINNCLSDDGVFSYFATLNGHPYLMTQNEYFGNMEGIEDDFSYSKHRTNDIITETQEFLEKRFGRINRMSVIENLFNIGELPNKYKTLLYDIIRMIELQKEYEIRSSLAYRIGRSIMKPVQFIRKTIFGKR